MRKYEAGRHVAPVDSVMHSENDLVRLHRIVNQLLSFLEKSLEEGPPFDGVEEIFGAKENVMSVITKLSQILLKIAPLIENQAEENNVDLAISEEEQEIVEQFIERYNQAQRDEQTRIS